MLIYVLAIFSGAFLLFALQPMIARFILPWFGGSPEIWTACMLFFQVLLLGGYTYAHLLNKYAPPKVQAAVHLALLAAAALTLPVIPNPIWEPADGGNPMLRILLLLSVTVGLPYLALSATSPLLQAWLTRASGGPAPYRLYALSNAGSFLALLAYPLGMEPWLSRVGQAWVWSWAWIGFAVLSAACAVGLLARRTGSLPSGSPGARKEEEATGGTPVGRMGETPMPRNRRGGPPEPPRETGETPVLPRNRILWLAMPACSSVVLLATTNVICLDLAVAPFLWLLPLGAYLLSWVVCFAGQRWYFRPVVIPAFVLLLLPVIWLRTAAEDVPILPQIAVYVLALFACCLVCHGELYRLRPAGRHLTAYYLGLAAGGAVGGFFVAVVAPLVFDSYIDLYIGLLVCCVFVLLALPRSALVRRRWLWIVIVAALTVVGVWLGGTGAGGPDRVVGRWRNFYGVLLLREKDIGNPALHRYVLQHGTTYHGVQFVDPRKRHFPAAYYAPQSGVGLAMRLTERPGRKVGVIGLGAGALAAYGRAGDEFVFYEINPAVKMLAQTRFSYLSDTPAEVRVVMGDARLSLKRQEPQQFDLLVADAFTSDAVPLHLLTLEAFGLYLRHLKDDGILAVHLSTRHLDLQSVVLRLGRQLGLEMSWIWSDEDADNGVFSADWILLSRDKSVLKAQAPRPGEVDLPPDLSDVPLWTDEHINLLKVLK